MSRGQYYVWPLLGFDLFTDGLRPALAEAGFSDVGDTLDLFRRDGGSEWWEANGWARDGIFYLDEGSPSILALSDYLEERDLLEDDGANEAETSDEAERDNCHGAQGKH